MELRLNLLFCYYFEEYQHILDVFTDQGLSRSQQIKLDMENLARASTNKHPIVFRPFEHASNLSKYIEDLGV